jgi:biopolymer transport protein ExbD
MSRKKGFLKRGLAAEEMSLQITSMADIFMILLVFLLKGYATSAVNLTPAAGLLLPEAQAQTAAVEALKLEISETAVLVEGTPATALKGFQYESKELQTNGTLRSLNDALKKQRDRQLQIAKVNSDVKVDPKIMVVADQRAPYQLIKSVLASAAVNGYTDFKLAVVKGD